MHKIAHFEALFKAKARLNSLPLTDVTTESQTMGKDIPTTFG